MSGSWVEAARDGPEALLLLLPVVTMNTRCDPERSFGQQPWRTAMSGGRPGERRRPPTAGPDVLVSCADDQERGDSAGAGYSGAG